MVVSFGQVIQPGKPLPNVSENERVWSGCIEIRKTLQNGAVSYSVRFLYERGDNRIDELVRKCLGDFTSQLSHEH